MFIFGIIISSIILILGIYFVTLSQNQRHHLVMILALILFFYKLTEYTIFGLTMQLHKIPLEFSTMSYFIFSMTIIFKLKKLQLLAAFMAFISGIGYLISFMILGDDYLFNNGLYLTSMALINHAILYLGSMLIIKDLNYTKQEERRIMVFTMMYVIYVSIMNELITFPQSFIFIRILLGGDLLTTYFSSDRLSSYTYLLYFLSVFILYKAILLIFHGICKLTHQPSEVNL
jgi:hypothetical protein